MVRAIIALVCLICSGTVAYGAAFFSDGFESGDLTHTENGAFWYSGGGTDAVVSAAQAKTGTHSMRFEFSIPVWSEHRFNLGANKTEVYIRYYIYFPTNYLHSNDGGSTNNKLIRLWSDPGDYDGDPIKVGGSLWYDATYKASLQLDAYETYPDNLSCSGGMDALTSWGTWKLTEEHLGKWLLFEWHMKRDSGAGDGALELWIDGEKVIGKTGQSWAGAPCGKGYFRAGYLFGYSNDDFAETTYFYVDDFTLSDTYTGTGDEPPTPTGSLRSGVSAAGVTFR